MEQTRRASVLWSGTLAEGSGTITDVTSGAFGGLGVSWPARTEAPGGKTSPEELLAAAHAACFSMALALKLGDHRVTPQQLEVSADVTLAEVDGAPTIATSALVVEATVPGLDSAGLDAIVAEAAALCPVSRLFAGAEITVLARLREA